MAQGTRDGSKLMEAKPEGVKSGYKDYTNAFKITFPVRALMTAPPLA